MLDAKQFRGEGLVASRFHFSPLDGPEYRLTSAPVTRSARAIGASAASYNPCAANLSVTVLVRVHPAAHTRGEPMQPSANEPVFPAMTDRTVDELNRIVTQAEALLRTLGDETGQAAEAVRDRVTDTL